MPRILFQYAAKINIINEIFYILLSTDLKMWYISTASSVQYSKVMAQRYTWLVATI